MQRLLTALLLGAAASAPTPPDGRWYAVQLHAHTRYSDGFYQPADLVRWAREGGLDALAITDHNTRRHLDDPAYKAPGLTLIPAYEWTEQMHAKAPVAERCHVSVWGLQAGTEVLPETLSRKELLRQAAAQGLTLGANHPYEPRFPWPDDDLTGVNAVEVWQWQYGLESPLGLPMSRTPHHDPLGFLYRNSRAITLWRNTLAAGQHVTPVAVADFHLGNPIQSLVSPCTLVWSEENTAGALLRNLRAGHVLLVEEPHGARVELRSDGALPGDTVPVGSHLQVHVTGGKGQVLSVYDGGGLLFTRQLTRNDYGEDWVAVQPGYYFARLDRPRWYNPLSAMSGALYVQASSRAWPPMLPGRR